MKKEITANNMMPTIPPRHTQIWVSDATCVWKQAEFISLDEKKKKILINYKDGSDPCFINFDSTFHVCNDQDVSSLSDLAQLAHLHEAALLNAIKKRFQCNIIYTYTGPILLAVNPFKKLPNIYETSMLLQYLEKVQTLFSLESLPPHVFGIAAAACSALYHWRKSQTVLISGESGAGKTESTKFIMKFFTLAGSEDVTKPSLIESQVLQSNPLLEAFGNAKTLRNHNSSRFGKFIEVHFRLDDATEFGSSNRKLLGALIETYLLESVRVCQQMEGERNYHIFYQLCAAASSLIKKNTTQYHFPSIIHDPLAQNTFLDLSRFKPVNQFRYLTKSSCYHLDSINDLEEFEHSILAMQTLGISQEEQQSIIALAGAVLHLGNLLFECCGEETEASKISLTCSSSLEDIVYFLNLPSLEELEHTLTHRKIIAGKETYLKPLTVKEAEETRDALARALYLNLFEKLVQRINNSISTTSQDEKLFCGVLDIFGFECFPYNSFEQLCINYTNERLQFFANTFIFKKEQELYQKEGVTWDVSDFPDNQECLDLLEKRNIGIFSMIHDECFIPKGNDRNLLEKFKTQYKDNSRFGLIKTKPEWFLVNHFAGSVPYCIDGFVEKNRDTLSQTLRDLIETSSTPLISSLFKKQDLCNETNETNTKQKRQSVALSFKQQLDDLMNTVGLSDPHLIRCIKPNSQCIPTEFNPHMVTEQLRYGGVLQSVQVSRHGYPVRLKHIDFLLLYRCLVPSRVFTKPILKMDPTDIEKAVTELLDDLVHQHECFGQFLETRQTVIGKTLVFFKQAAYNTLTDARARLRVQMATKITSVWLGTLQRRYYLHLKACTIIIQAYYRGYLARKEAKRLKIEKATILLQTCVRRIQTHREIEDLRIVLITLQSLLRCYRYKAEVVRREAHENDMATRIQKVWRLWQQKKVLRSQQKVLCKTTVDDPSSLRERLNQITAALEKIKLEKIMLEEKLNKVQAFSPCRGSLKDIDKDQATQAPSFCRTSPSSLDMSEWGKSPVNSVETVVQLNLSQFSLPETDTPFKRVKMKKVQLGSSSPLTFKESRRGFSEITDEYIAWIQAKYATKHCVIPETSDVSQCNAVTSISCENVGLAHIVILGHYGRTFEDQQTDQMDECCLLDTLNFQESVLSLYSLNHGGNFCNIACVDFFLPTNMKEAYDLKNVSVFVLQLILQCHFLLIRWESIHNTSFTYMRNIVKQIQKHQLKPHMFFWRQTTSLMTTNDEQILHDFPDAVVISDSLPELIEKKWLNYADENTGESSKGKLDFNSLKEKNQQTLTTSQTCQISILHHTNDLPEKQRLLSFESPFQDNGKSSNIAGRHLPAATLFGGFKTKPAVSVSMLMFSQVAYNRSDPYYILAVGTIRGALYLFRVYCNSSDKTINKPIKFHLREINNADNQKAAEKKHTNVEQLWYNSHAHHDNILGIAFSTENLTLYSASADASVCLWEIYKGKLLRKFKESTRAIAFSAVPSCSSYFLLSNTEGSLWLVDSEKNSLIQKLQFSFNINSLCFNDEGNLCFAASNAGILLILSMYSSNTYLRLQNHTLISKYPIQTLCYIPKTPKSSPSIVAGMENGDIVILQIHSENPFTLTSRNILKAEYNSQSTGPCYSCFNGGWLLAPTMNGVISLFSIDHFLKVSLPYHESSVISIAGNSSSTLFASGDTSGKIALWR